jgi:predicted AlkP superfamily phosphohydrolase/phosphomutase
MQRRRLSNAVQSSPLLLCAPLLAGLVLGTTGCRRSQANKPARKLLILGVDGMDPLLLQQYIDEGRVPNLARMARQGTFVPLGTSTPPQSPVAWSNFMTGTTPEHHGIYDFVHRDPQTLSPYLSTSRTTEAETIEIGPWAITTTASEIELLRGGRAFWELLADRGLASTVLKIPANFPPAGKEPAEVLAGMGTPDLLGTYGTFYLLTDDPVWLAKDQPSGGQISELSAIGPQRQRGTLLGPPNPGSSEHEPLELPVEVVVDHKRPVALITIGSSRVLLKQGEWSEWIPITFDGGLLGGEVPGMVRAYLRSLHPRVQIYLTPINLDPMSPAMPLSNPSELSTQIAREVGRFYTQGMPEDTKALAAGTLNDDEFLAQADLVFNERRRLLDRALDRFEKRNRGVLFFYFSSIDQVCHVFYRALREDASAHDRRYAHVIPDLYAEVDRVIGETLKRVSDDTLVLVMSDHGFAHYRRKVHLNTWLAQEGFLVLRKAGDVQPGPLGHIDWKRTQAYALGLNQLFINLQGREKQGAVDANRRKRVLDRISRGLRALRDPETGRRVVGDLHRPEKPVASSPTESAVFAKRTPDLIVGYRRGYRSSDESALGKVGKAVFEDNHDKWSGDHCMDPREVPGVLLSPVKLEFDGYKPSLLDIAPTVLAYFGMESPQKMTGRSLMSAGAQQ